MNNLMTPVISFVAAKSGSGKTTLLEKVVKKLKERNLKLAIIKHDGHGFEMDHEGKDTWRFSQAGVDVVAIASAGKVAIIEKTSEEKALDKIIATLPNVDLIITEGYKHGNKPKIEVIRSAVHNEIISKKDQLVAIASDIKWHTEVPCYDINDADGIAKEIIRYMENFSQQQDSFHAV